MNNTANNQRENAFTTKPFTITRQLDGHVLHIHMEFDRHFSITGSSSHHGSGCIHEAILEAVPGLQPVVDLHLCDEFGIAIHQQANARYFIEVAQGKRKDTSTYQSMQRSEEEQARAPAAIKNILRATDKEVQALIDGTVTLEHYSAANVIRWREEALTALKTMHHYRDNPNNFEFEQIDAVYFERREIDVNIDNVAMTAEDKKRFTKNHQRWQVTFTSEKGGEIDFTYYSREEPSIADVVRAVISDAQAGTAETFEEFASDFGYDSDSREAERIYMACKQQAYKVGLLFGTTDPDEWQRLHDLAEDSI